MSEKQSILGIIGNNGIIDVEKYQAIEAEIRTMSGIKESLYSNSSAAFGSKQNKDIYAAIDCLTRAIRHLTDARSRIENNTD